MPLPNSIQLFINIEILAGHTFVLDLKMKSQISILAGVFKQGKY